MAHRDLRQLRDSPDPYDLGELGGEIDRLAVEVAALARAVEAAIAECGPPLELASRVAPLSALAAPGDPQARRLLARHRRWQRLIRGFGALHDQPRD